MDTDHVSCTWKDENQCTDCENFNRLNCRWKASDLLLFLAVVLPSMMGLLASTLLIGIYQGAWWPTATYILFFPIVLGVAETRFLCSHCPYYAQEGRVLHCLANHGLLKFWRYHPEPMNKMEKALMILLGTVFLLLMPGAVLGYTVWFFSENLSLHGPAALIAVIGLSVVTVGSLLAFVFVMVKSFCSGCINFSCPFNRVDKGRRDSYLKRNPFMKKAWEESGYSIE